MSEESSRCVSGHSKSASWSELSCGDLVRRSKGAGATLWRVRGFSASGPRRVYLESVDENLNQRARSKPAFLKKEAMA